MKTACLSHRKLMSVGLTALLCAAGVYAQEAASTDPALARAQLAKAIAEAEKAETEAKAAEAKAKFGTLADYPATGATTAGADAGKLESSLLASEATREAARAIVTQVCITLINCADAKAAPVIITSDDQKIMYDAYDAFNVQARLIERQLDDAIKLEVASSGGATSLTTVTSFTAAAAALGVVANLLRSDYSLSNITLTADDQLLAKAVLSEAGSKGRPFQFPGQYSRPLDMETNPALRRLSELDTKRTDLVNEITDDKNKASELLEQAANAKNKPLAEQLKKQAANYAPITAAREAALKRYDDFLAKLGTGDDKGVIPLSIVVRQAANAEQISRGATLLVLKANYQGGSAYTKKNFWTFFGTMPFHVGGGMIASFTLINGETGNVLDAGVYGYTAPFAKVHRAISRYDNGNPVAKK